MGNADLIPLFKDVASTDTYFSSTYALEAVVCKAFERYRKNFPRAFRYRDAIDCALDEKWLIVSEAGYHLEVPAN